MKRRMLIWGLIILTVCLFFVTASADIVANDSLVVLKGVNWGETIDQVKAAVSWGYPETDRGNITYLSYSKINYPFEGLKARTAELSFQNDRLVSVMYIFSGETVYETLVKKQNELFGEEKSSRKNEYTEECVWELNDGTRITVSSISGSTGAYIVFENDSYKQEQAAKQTDPGNVEILFRDIPWGSSYKEATSRIAVKFWTKPHDDYASTVKSGLMGGHDLAYKYYIRCRSDGEPNLSVAGYPVEKIRLWFVYTPDSNGHLTKSENDTALYLAEYQIKPKDINAVEKDLIEKLSSVYGDVDEQASEGTVIKEDHYLWYGSNNAVCVLTARRSNSSTTIDITYGWLDGDEYLQRAYEALAAEEAESMGNGNTDGL